MENEKNVGEADISATEEGDNNLASRARNRTVMLTPEITGEVRARLAQDLTEPEEEPSSAPSDVVSSYSPASDSTSEPVPYVESAPRPPSPPAPPTAAPAPARTVSNIGGEGVYWSKLSPVIGFLVSYDVDENGTIFELRSGRLIVSNTTAGEGNCLVIHDETVSPMHAIIRVATDCTIQVLDQLSEFGTKIIRLGDETEEELSGEKSMLGHGDILMFGERSFHVCTIVPHVVEEDDGEQ